MFTNHAARRVTHRYELEAELGHGGTDMAWRATDISMGLAA